MNTRAATPATSVVTVDDLDAGYGGVQILHQVSMTARTGEVTCIFGPNGCGKSTLLKAMVGVIDPWAGTITLDDDDLTHLPSHRTLGRGLAMMPQGGGVFPQLSVRDNLRIGGYTIRSRKQLDRRIDELLEAFPRLRERYDVQAGQLSGGEQMILSIARALVLRPRFLLFDEPSAGLSPKLVGDVLVRAAELARARGGRDHDRAEHPRGVAGGRPDVRPGGAGGTGSRALPPTWRTTAS